VTKRSKACPDCGEIFTAYFIESLDTMVAIHRLGMHSKHTPSVKSNSMNDLQLTKYDRDFLKGCCITT